MTGPEPPQGMRRNARRIVLLVVVNAFVGAMVGLERSVLPMLAADRFGVASATAVLTFLVAFGSAKAAANLAAGGLADRYGRRPLLIAGWLVALPVAPMIAWAPAWHWVVGANVLLGVNQGFAWSATAIMKVDLAPARRRGLVLALNESAGYGAVGLMAWLTGALAAAGASRSVFLLVGLAIAVTGLVLSVGGARETKRPEHGSSAGGLRRVLAEGTFRDRTLSAVSLAGMANNLNDAMAWGLLPLYLASRGFGLGRIGIVAGAYPAAWTVLQLVAGPLSDRVGRKPLIAGGLFVQAFAIACMSIAGSFAGLTASAVLMGAGTAMVYPTLIASAADAVAPARRASAIGVYRLWRDLGYVAGAVLTGAVADVLGSRASIAAVSIVTAAAGVLVVLRVRETLPVRSIAAVTVRPAAPGL